jgi:hypothetical protein
MKGADTGELGRLGCSWARSHASWATREAKGRQADWAGGWESAQNSNQIRKKTLFFLQTFSDFQTPFIQIQI